MSAQKCDVVIVGGGVSGMAAAYRLHQRNPDLKVVVLEAKDRLGGRTQTVTLQSNRGFDQWDMGGQWVGRTQHPLLELLQDLNIQMYPQYITGKKIAQLGSATPFTYSTDLPTFGPLTTLKFIRLLLEIERLSRKYPLANPFSVGDAHLHDEITVSGLLRSYAGGREQAVADAVEAALRVVFGVDGSKINALYLLMYGYAAGTFGNTLEVNGDGSQAFRIKGGSAQICERLAELLGNNNTNVTVLKNSPVIKIATLEVSGGVDVTIAAENTQTYRCDRVIIAIPPCQAQGIHFDPVLPPMKRELLANFPMGNLIKFVVTYHRPFWREKGYSGEICARGYVEGQPDKVAPICVTFDATTNNDCPALVGFINQEWADSSQEERKDAVIHDLARYFGHDALHYIDYMDKDWSLETYVGGCPVSVLPPGHMSAFVSSIRDPIGSLHWASTETATDWPGYISGAVQAGQRAASEVLFNLCPSMMSKNDLEGTVYAKNYTKPQLPLLIPKQSLFTAHKWTLLSIAGALVISGIIYFTDLKAHLPESPVEIKFISK